MWKANLGVITEFMKQLGPAHAVWKAALKMITGFIQYFSPAHAMCEARLSIITEVIEHCRGPPWRSKHIVSGLRRDVQGEPEHDEQINTISERHQWTAVCKPQLVHEVRPVV